MKPAPELVQQWLKEAADTTSKTPTKDWASAFEMRLCELAAAWGSTKKSQEIALLEVALSMADTDYKKHVSEIERLTAERDKYHMECLERRLPENNGAMEREEIERLRVLWKDAEKDGSEYRTKLHQKTEQIDAMKLTINNMSEILDDQSEALIRKDALLREVLAVMFSGSTRAQKLAVVTAIKTELGENNAD